MKTHTPTPWTAATAAALALGLAAGARAQATDPHAGYAAPAASPAESAPVDDRARSGIEEALQDEWQGEAIYARVLKDHGDVRPFSNVVRAERRHSAFLEERLKARGLAVPENRWAKAEVPASASVKEACAAAVEFETRNVALYDRLVAAGPLPDDVRKVYDHNRMASLDHHKPAFERCAGLGTARGQGRAAGRAQGCGHCGHGHGGGQARGGAGHGCGHGSGGGAGGPATR